MAAFCFFLLFSLLSFTSSATLSRRYLSDAAVLSPPFFPLYSASSPPPPPPPAPSLPPPATTVATFPANISALVLPRSPKPQPSSHKLLIPVISAVLAVAIAIGIALFLYGRYRSQIPNLKDESKSLAAEITQSESRNTTNNNLSVAATTSEIHFHSNVVTTSSSVNERSVAPRSSFVKPESPEIRPLPPLPACSFIQYYETNPLTEEEEDNDDFYSPLASLAGTENTIRPGLATQDNNLYSTCSCSSSSSDSPVLSQTVTNSPPMSSTVPHWSGQNPKSEQVERRVRSNKRNGSLPLRMFSLWNQNVGFPRISSASTSPERGMIRTPDAYARSSMYSSVSTSPDRFFRKATENSPPKWTDLSRNVKSLLLSSTSVSPSRDFCINIGESSRYLKSSWENPEVATSEHFESAAPPPPQRPPPPPLAAQKPPPLVPPSQPFVGKKLSFSELPQNCWEAERPKPKLKPLPWDKVRPSSYRKTSWDRLRSNSFKLNEGIMETPSSSNTKSKQRRSLSCDLPMINQDIRVSDPRKGQNITVLLTTLKLTTKDVYQALLDGDYESLGVDLLERLSVMAPTEEEEDMLKIHSDDSAIKLTPSDRFLKELLNVPFAFERVNALLSVANFNSELEHLKKSFSVIQAACEELRNNRILLKLLEAVLETGNRTNVETKSGDAHEFKLDTVQELLDLQGLDGRTNLIHSVLQNIIESEGTDVSEKTCCTKLGLQVISNLNSALVYVKKSSDMDYDVLRSDVSKLYERVQKISEILQLSEESGVNEKQWWKFRESITQFLETAAEELQKIEKQEVSALYAAKQITEYFHGYSAKEEAQVLRIFVIVRDFLSILDEVCKEMEGDD